MEADTGGLTVLELSTALLECPELVRPHLGSLVPIDDSEPLTGTFIHVAAGVVVDDPLETFFGREAERIAASNRTLIVAEANSSVAYIEGCAAPIYTTHADRRSTVEVIVGSAATVRHTTIQNWSTNVRHSVTKHAVVAGAGRVEWLDAALGSSTSKTQLVSRLCGATASASVLSAVSAGTGQHHDTEVVTVHEANDTSSTTVSKLLGSGTGSVSCRHVLQMDSTTSLAEVQSESLDIEGAADLDQRFAATGDGAVSVVVGSDERRIDELHLEYLMGRGLSRTEAVGMVVIGYLAPIARGLPLEYAVEWERAMQFSVEQSMT